MGVIGCVIQHAATTWRSVTMFKIVEKNNPLAVHCLCDTLERAKHWLYVKAPFYVENGFFMDKTLTPDSFTIINL
jgi:hypothetical protein